MRVVFFGTPDVAVESLRALMGSTHEVVAVVTQPDKPRGRGRSVSASPVKELAADHGVPVLQPASPKEDGFADTLRSYEPDALAVVAYGHILPRDVLSVARAMNVHFSLLPKYRGAAPVQRALMAGETETGVSVFMLEPTVDTGPVLAVESVAIGPEQTAGDVFETLAPIGARLLVAAIDALEAGTATPLPQRDEEATPAPKIKPEETVVDWTRSAAAVADQVRALNPNPGAHATFRDGRLLIWRARVAEGQGAPGTVLRADTMLVVAAGSGAVELVEVQPEGKRRMDGAAFARGYRPIPGMGLSDSRR
jgi:methionyl-tRNA formyltransferase